MLTCAFWITAKRMWQIIPGLVGGKKTTRMTRLNTPQMPEVSLGSSFYNQIEKL